jgi:hypothetical protein
MLLQEQDMAWQQHDISYKAIMYLPAYERGRASGCNSRVAKLLLLRFMITIISMLAYLCGWSLKRQAVVLLLSHLHVSGQACAHQDAILLDHERL